MGGRAQTIKEVLSQPENLAAVKRELGTLAEPSRTALATVLCEQLGLEDTRGNPQVASCLKALRDLEQAGHLTLPPPQLTIISHWRPRRLSGPVDEPEGAPDLVDAVEDLRLVLVAPDDDDAMRTWNELIAREHPRGLKRFVGRQLKYLVASAHGYLGAVGFSASALRLEARDRWIGWDRSQQQSHRDRILNLSRLLIRPMVRCRNLASYVLGQCLARVAKDFEARYGYCPWLIESFVDRERHAGTCFRAANFEAIGQTKGRGRNDRHRRRGESLKDIYVYPLETGFRSLMGVPPDRGDYLRPRAVEEGQGSQEWVRTEFGTVELGTRRDKRLRERLIKIMEDRAKRPDASYLEAAAGDLRATDAYYYFVDNDKADIQPEAIMATHRERTIERIMARKTVLVVQDTSDLNFAGRYHTQGLGLIGKNQSGAESAGLQLHSSLVLTTDGLPLGVLRIEFFAPKKVGKKGKKCEYRPIEEKKTFRWLTAYRDCVEVAKRVPNTHFLVLADREGDLFELFNDAEPTRHRVGLIVRAKHDRKLHDNARKLFEEVKGSPQAFQVETIIPRQRWKKAKKGNPEQASMPARQARLTIRYQRVEIATARCDLHPLGTFTLWAVHAYEDNPPLGAKRIEWFLLTTEKVETTDDAAQIVSHYIRRWRIEEWHHVLKSGCKVQEHQHETAERLMRVIAMDAVLAWRIQLMTLLGREVPDLPCTVFFDEWEVRVLEALEAEKGKRGRKPPFTLGEAIIMVARQGGYLARKSDPPPGPKVIWKGLIRLYSLAAGYRLAVFQTRAPP